MEGKGLRLALPKGHLQSQTLDLFGEAAYHIQGYSEESRSYRPTLDDDEIVLKVLRAQEIPMYVESGSHDVGVTGDDWVRESRADVIQLCDLEYGWVKMVLAVPSVPNGVTSFEQLLDRYWDKGVRISTEYLRLAEAYVMSQETYRSRTSLAPSIITPWSREITGSPVEVILSFGATEAKPPEDAEAVIENTTSLRTLLENQLRVIDTVLPSSTAHLIANKDALREPWKAEKIREIQRALEGVVRARHSFHVFVNVPLARLEEAKKVVPAMKEVSTLRGEKWARIDFVVAKRDFRDVLMALKALGAEDILRYSPGQVIL